MALTIKQLEFKIHTDIDFKNTTEKHLTGGIEGKQHYLSKIMSFIERVPLETDNMLSVRATESGAIFEQFPGFAVQFDKF